MKRRTILKYTAYLTGAVVSAPLASIILSGCQSDAAAADNYQPKFFNENEMSQLRSLVDVILPKTDSPSASEAGVHRVIDSMVGEVYTAEQQADFRKDFTALTEQLAMAGFQNKNAAAQVQILHGLESSPVKEAWLDLRQQTIAYYLSSAEIGTKYLNYLPVPGEYQPCISVEEAGGKLWAI
ncbi:MAG: gluconate 2-dehydrogenase subunit 3 family protein [Bacteroidota bacterium]